MIHHRLTRNNTDQAEKMGLSRGCSRRRNTVLIIEDHFDFAETVRKRLESVGYKVSITADVDSSIHRIREGNLNLLVFDSAILSRKGWHSRKERIGWISSAKNIPVIVLTGRISDDEIARRVQADDVFIRVQRALLN